MSALTCPPECPLFTLGSGFAPLVGGGHSGVLLLGEALGAEEVKASAPFVGPAGKMLSSLLRRGGLERDDFRIGNCCNCRPPSNFLEGATYEADAISFCNKYFQQWMIQHQSLKVVAPLGNIPLWKMVGQKGIGEWHGTVSWNAEWERWVVPTFHPSHLLQGEIRLTPVVVADLLRAVKVARYGFTRRPLTTLVDPPLDGARWWFEEYYMAQRLDPDGVWLSVDIETPYSPKLKEDVLDEKDPSTIILRIGFSYELRSGISVPWSYPYTELVRQALAHGGTKLFWNGEAFDVPRLLAAGMPVSGMRVDGMVAHHFVYSDLPKDLGFTAPIYIDDLEAWKHLFGVNLGYYNALDAIHALEIGYEIRSLLKAEARWETFVDHFVKMAPLTHRMSEIGIGIDTRVRDAFKEKTQLAVQAAREQLVTQVPQAFADTLIAKVYKKEPAAAVKQQHRCLLIEDTGQWIRLKDFNPGSPQQLLAYIEYKYGAQAIPLHKRTKKPTTERVALEKLARKKHDTLLPVIIELNKKQDMLDSFIEQWKPGLDGRVHPTLTDNPATFRFSSKNPNEQNLPRRDEEQAEIRKMIVGGSRVGDGWFLVARDYTGIEAVIVAYIANDPDYMRLAKLGVHAYFASHMMSLKGLYNPIYPSLSEGDLRVAVKEAKRVAEATPIGYGGKSYYDAAKQTIHAISYAEGEWLMQQTYPEMFPTLKAAGEARSLFFDLFPRVEWWQHSVVEQAYQPPHRLRNVFGYDRWFYNVKRWDSKTAKKGCKREGCKYCVREKMVWGDGAKEAIATGPQGTAAGIMRRTMRLPAIEELARQGLLLFTIHDELLARAYGMKDAEKVDAILRSAMEAPVVEMGGLVIQTSGKVGVSWGEMKEVE